jgi:hypothetical protein
LAQAEDALRPPVLEKAQYVVHHHHHHHHHQAFRVVGQFEFFRPRP